MKKFLRIRWMLQLYIRIFPAVHRALRHWKKEAAKIPNVELKKQAQNSLKTKSFHCEGGGAFAFLVRQNKRAYIEFVVAFQTISDYLDNLCDRSTECSERHFQQLHLAMSDALNPQGGLHDYYQYSENQADGGYLLHLVEKCRACLSLCRGYDRIQSEVQRLNANYIYLQVYKHLPADIREEKLKDWIFHVNAFPYGWHTFAAATGSTLGIFMLVAYAMHDGLTETQAADLFHLYFPYVQGFHILLDYYIDQNEDEAEGDLNFCTYFTDTDAFYQQMDVFYREVLRLQPRVRDGDFHLMLMQAMLGLYLADPKAKRTDGGLDVTKRLLAMGGKESAFFHRQVKMYRRICRET